MEQKLTPKTERIEGTRSGAQQIMEVVKRYLEVLDVWEADPKAKEQFYKRIRILIQYQFALAAPVPVILTMVERNMEETYSRDGTSSSGIYLPDSLRKKVEIVSKQLGSTVNETAALVLAENIKYYAKNKKLLSTDGEEEDDEKGDDLFDL
jgi:hypothetical protein